MKKISLNNNLRFPSIIAGKIKFSTNRYNNETFCDENDMLFSGDSVVIEKSNKITTFDMLLLLQIVEYYQKNKDKSMLINKNNTSELEFEKEDKDMYLKEIYNMCENKDSEHNIKYKSLQIEQKKQYIFNLLKEKIDNENYKKYNIYPKTDDCYKLRIEVSELLKARGLKNQIENRKVIMNSLETLFSTYFKFYFLKDELKQKFKEVKSNKIYKEWKGEISELFQKHKSQQKIFFRHLISSIDIEADISFIEIEVNKGFLDYCEISKFFDYSILMKLSSSASKAFFINSAFALKNVLSKEYLFEIMDLNYSQTSKNLVKAQESIEELIQIGYLSKKSKYDKSTSNFYIELNKPEKPKTKKKNYKTIKK